MITGCGADCGQCGMKENCKGCVETNGYPFGKECFIAKYINVGDRQSFRNSSKS